VALWTVVGGVVALTSLVLAVFGLGGSSGTSGAGASTSSATRPTSSSPAPTGLAAPSLVVPTDRSTFSTYPRRLQVVWSPVAGAATYSLEVDFECGDDLWCPLANVGGSGIATGLTRTNYTFEFVGAQPGRWRVWAVDADGKQGSQSMWRYFEFTA
jgi:eukaryotic-like serine/threonine-protein kinase